MGFYMGAKRWGRGLSTLDEGQREFAPLRGDLADTASMEILQIGYLHAVAAAAKCSIAAPNPDKRLDWIITHQSSAHTAGDDEATLKVALKSTTQVTPKLAGETFPFTL